ncbi:hypothetical protein VTK73DRAFT_10062 [Phialemonium thermophilum]|uniref:Uncharacterized protein n=1 Tax=Phialemonium thermophilum TaxID=223376 RepID=A0ABR3VYX2_9PEZI
MRGGPGGQGAHGGLQVALLVAAVDGVVAREGEEVVSAVVAVERLAGRVLHGGVALRGDVVQQRVVPAAVRVGGAAVGPAPVVGVHEDGQARGHGQAQHVLEVGGVEGVVAARVLDVAAQGPGREGEAELGVAAAGAEQRLHALQDGDVVVAVVGGEGALVDGRDVGDVLGVGAPGARERPGAQEQREAEPRVRDLHGDEDDEDDDSIREAVVARLRVAAS